MRSKIINFKDLKVEHPNRYKVTDSNGTEDIKKIDFDPGLIYQQGTPESAENFNNIQKNCIYEVSGVRILEGQEEIYDISIDGFNNFEFENLKILMTPNATNTIKGSFIRLNGAKYIIKNRADSIAVGQIFSGESIFISLDFTRKTADVAATLSGGSIKTLKEVDDNANGRVSKKGDTMSGNLKVPKVIGDVQGNSDTAGYLKVDDDERNPKPNTTGISKGVCGVKSFFSTGAALGLPDAYYDLIVFDTFRDSTGGRVNALAFSKRNNSLHHIGSEFDSDSWSIEGRLYTTEFKPSKDDVGLGEVQNYPVTSATNDTSNTKYGTAGAVKKAYDKGVEALGVINTHAGKVDNPHKVTKSQVGLSNVENYPVTSSFTDGSDTKYATAKAVKTAYEKANLNRFSSIDLNTLNKSCFAFLINPTNKPNFIGAFSYLMNSGYVTSSQENGQGGLQIISDESTGEIGVRTGNTDGSWTDWTRVIKSNEFELELVNSNSVVSSNGTYTLAVALSDKIRFTYIKTGDVDGFDVQIHRVPTKDIVNTTYLFMGIGANELCELTFISKTQFSCVYKYVEDKNQVAILKIWQGNI